MCTAGTSSFEQVQVFELCPSERLNRGPILLDLNEARTARLLRSAIVRRRRARVQFLTPILTVIGNILTRPFSVHPGGSFITPYFLDERVVKSIGKFHVWNWWDHRERIVADQTTQYLDRSFSLFLEAEGRAERRAMVIAETSDSQRLNRK